MDALDKEMYSIFSLMGNPFGLKDSHMKLLAALYMEPDYVTTDDLVKKTGYSLASISLSIRLLEEMGIVSHMKKPGTKKLYYLLEKDLFLVNIKKMEMMDRRFIQPVKRAMPGMLKKYKAKAKNNDLMASKLKIIERFNRQLLVMEKLINKWQKDLEGQRDG
jgi:HTH-type transcriptional regulator, osmoprotectant uptake regulator